MYFLHLLLYADVNTRWLKADDSDYIELLIC